MKIDIEPHWVEELSKLRCWITGFKAGRGETPFGTNIPGADVLRQIEIAIRDSKKTKKK